MKKVLLSVMVTLLLAACSKSDKVCCRNFEVTCPEDTSTVLKLTMMMDTGGEMNVPCGQMICNELAAWSTQELDNILFYLDERDTMQYQLRGLAYRDGMTQEEIVEYYAGQMCSVVKELLPGYQCQDLPCGPITVYMGIRKVWENNSRTTFMIHRDWDYSGSCGATYLTRYLTLDRETGRVLKLGDMVHSRHLMDMEKVVYDRLMKLKKERGADMSGEEEEGSSMSYFYDNHVSLEDIVSQRGDSLVFMFPPYTVGCGAEGDYEVVVPMPAQAK